MSQSILILLIAAGAVLALLVLVVVFTMRDPRGAARRVESLFRRPRKQPKQPGANHYYKPYWS